MCVSLLLCDEGSFGRMRKLTSDRQTKRWLKDRKMVKKCGNHSVNDRQAKLFCRVKSFFEIIILKMRCLFKNKENKLSCKY